LCRRFCLFSAFPRARSATPLQQHPEVRALRFRAGTIWGFPALKGWDASTGVGTLAMTGYSIFRAMLLAASA
jgi:hypothetical protein